MPMWAWIAMLAGGGLAIGGAAYVVSQQKPVTPPTPIAPANSQAAEAASAVDLLTQNQIVPG